MLEQALPYDRTPARILILVAMLTAAALAPPGSADDFYLDPVAGSPGGNGSAGDPWRTLEEVVAADLIETRNWESLPYEEGLALVPVNPGAPVGAGDTLWLLSGYHGELVIIGAYNESPITIAAAPGHIPELRSIQIRSAQNWVIRSVSVSPSHAPPLGSQSTIVKLEDHSWTGPSWDLTVEDGEIFTVDDASGWGPTEWVDAAWSGVSVSGERLIVRRNRLRNVRFGISVGGEDAWIEENLIDGFSADGLRGLGDGSIFAYNIVKNAFVDSAHDPNHDDGFQSWTVGPGGVGTGEVRDVVLRGNIFINNEDPGHPLFSSLQGIGCFDGFFVNWTVENNVVITDHWHGINFSGIRDSRIVNNTVIDLISGSPGPPWVRVADHKDGTPSQNVVVRNNLTTDLSVSGINMISDHNLEFTDGAMHFVAPPFDLHLLPTSSAIDSGSAGFAPAFDVEQNPRPQGPGFDIGAYEWVNPILFADGFESGDTTSWGQCVP